MARTRTEGGKWTEAEARSVLAKCEASGLSMRAFAHREGIRPRRLYWWTKRLRGDARGRVELDALRFVPAIVKPGGDEASVRVRPAVAIRVGPRATLEIVDPSAVSVGWVADVLVELERVACS